MTRYTDLTAYRARMSRTRERRVHAAELTDAQLLASLVRLFAHGHDRHTIRQAWQVRYGRPLKVSDGMLREAEGIALAADALAERMLRVRNI